MSTLTVAFLIVVLVPLFAGSWRVSLTGLAGQGLLLAWMGVVQAGRATPDPLTLADTLALRGLVAPLLLYVTLRQQGVPARNEVIPPNMLFWTLAGALVLGAFRFVDLEPLAIAPQDRTRVAAATAALLMALLVVAARDAPLTQMIGLLRIENAIALFELDGAHRPRVEVQLGMMAVYLLTVLTFIALLWRLQAAQRAPTPPDEVLL